MTRLTRGAVFALGVLVVLFPGHPISANSFALALFEQYLESLRQQVGIPGLSAAIVQDERIVWERGLGFEDVENSVRATPDTPYLVGGITETLGSVVVLSYAERGRVGLDAPISRLRAVVSRFQRARGRRAGAHVRTNRPGRLYLQSVPFRDAQRRG